MLRFSTIVLAVSIVSTAFALPAAFTSRVSTELATQVVGPGGGTVSATTGSGNKIYVAFPVGALDAPAKITVLENSGRARLNAGKQVGCALQVVASVAAFGAPVTISVPYIGVPVAFAITADGEFEALQLRNKHEDTKMAEFDIIRPVLLIVVDAS